MPSRRRGRDGTETHERLLRAGLELFTTSGIDGTTTAALAERAEIAEGTIYRHFPGKRQLFNTVYARGQQWALARIRITDGDRARRVPERLLALGRGMIDTAESDPALLRMVFFQADPTVLDDPGRSAAQAFRDALTQLVAMGKADGLVRAGPADLWGSVWLALVRFAVERVCGGEWTPGHPQVGLVLDAAWSAIAAGPAPASTSPLSDGTAGGSSSAGGPFRPPAA
jgi:AcrR family transcriptional regulator